MTNQNETHSITNTKHKGVKKMKQQYYNVTQFDNLDDFTEWKEDLFSNPDFEYFASFESLEELFETFKYYDFSTQQIEQLLSTRYGNVIEVGIIESELYTFTGAR